MVALQARGSVTAIVQGSSKSPCLSNVPVGHIADQSIVPPSAVAERGGGGPAMVVAVNEGSVILSEEP